MKFSIVTTMFYSAPYLREFYDRITNSIHKITDDYEIIFVNDGSPDNSLELAIEIYNKDPKVKIIDLSRNFGHHKAIMTGLSKAEGDYVFLIDCDLEEEPELIEMFWRTLNTSNTTDVAYGVQEQRKGQWLEKYSGEIFYYIFNTLSNITIPPNFVTCRLMKRKYVEALLEFKEQEIFLGGLLVATGFNQVPITVIKHNISPSTYSLHRKISLFLNSITSFSNRPLIYIFYLGLIISGLSIIASIYLFCKKIFVGINVEGWTSLIVSLWFIGGLIIFCIGIVGIYLSRIFMEVKNRPYTIIKDFYMRN